MFTPCYPRASSKGFKIYVSINFSYRNNITYHTLRMYCPSGVRLCDFNDGTECSLVGNTIQFTNSSFSKLTLNYKYKNNRILLFKM